MEGRRAHRVRWEMTWTSARRRAYQPTNGATRPFSAVRKISRSCTAGARSAVPFKRRRSVIFRYARQQPRSRSAAVCRERQKATSTRAGIPRMICRILQAETFNAMVQDQPALASARAIKPSMMTGIATAVTSARCRASTTMARKAGRSRDFYCQPPPQPPSQPPPQPPRPQPTLFQPPQQQQGGGGGGGIQT